MTAIGEFRIFIFSALCAAVFAASATDWYVDARNGNDAWDGTRPIATAEGIAGPRKTLVAAMALAGVGDTVHAAEGTYDQGAELHSSSACSNRVVILPGRKLVASGRRDKTIIKGYGYGKSASTNSIRCVYLIRKDGNTPGGVVKGFTITGGNTLPDAADGPDNCGGGVAGSNMGSIDGNGLVVECNIYDNTSGNRGANVFAATLLRCRVGNAGRDLDCYQGAKLIDSYYCGNQGIYWNVQFYNCTHSHSGHVYGNGLNAYLYNCLFLHQSYSIGKGAAYTNCFFRVPKKVDSDTRHYDSNCRFSLTAEELAMSKLDACRPTMDSVVKDQGILSEYLKCTNGWSGAWQAEFNLTDFCGRPRLRNGKLDVGCCQAGEFDVYVDAVNGDDANNGYSRAAAVKTLARAMDVSLPGDVVHAAEGVYDEGEMYVEGTCSNRVVVLSGRKLVADGRRDKTVIMGALATDAGGPNLHGCGSNAVRCVYLQTGASGLPGGIVKGFTIKNGRTHATFNDKGVPVENGNGDTWYTCGGGAAGYGLVVDCDFVDCGASSRGPNACYYAKLLRCRLNPSVCGNYDCFQNCVLVDCLYKNTPRIYQNPMLYNCTLTNDKAVYSLSSQSVCRNCLFLGTSADVLVGDRMHYTNCIARAAWQNKAGSDYDVATCRFGVSEAEVAAFAGGWPWRCSIALGAGSVAEYLKATNGWHEAYREEFTLKDCAGNPRIVDGKISVGCYEYAEMYADAVNGDDENDGLTPTTAKKTLKGVLESGLGPMTVKLAAGTYDEGATNVFRSLTRAYVPTGWAFEGAGRGKTIIKGFRSDENADGLGDDAVRCAVVAKDAYLRGVTLQGGFTPTNSVAGGVYLRGGALVDSEITGCKGGKKQGSDYRGSAAYGPSEDGWLIGDYIHGNDGTLQVYDIRMVNSVLDTAYYGDFMLLNNWIEGDAKVKGWNYTKAAYNCVILKGVGRGFALTNCVIGEKFSYSTDINHPENNFTNNGYDKATCVIDASKSQLRAGMDAKFRPLHGSMLLDAGNREFYDRNFPERWAMFKGSDYAGGARVLNGQIDIGAGEYNWMEDFAAVISARNAEMTEAGANVSISGDALVIPGGESITATWSSTRTRWANFSATVPGGGTLVVKVNGVTLTPEGGVYRFQLNPGDNTLSIAYAGSDSSRVFDFAMSGFAMILR